MMNLWLTSLFPVCVCVGGLLLAKISRKRTNIQRDKKEKRYEQENIKSLNNQVWWHELAISSTKVGWTIA